VKRATAEDAVGRRIARPVRPARVPPRLPHPPWWIVGLLAAFCILGLVTARAEQKKEFRVCADPENLPFSNRRQEGFENKIADIMAHALGAPSPTYIWWGQRRGFVRNTMDATLKEGRCDVMIGVPAGYDLVLTTKPYYRSTYVAVSRKGAGPPVTSLDDARLKKFRIGVQLLGDDYNNPPPVHALAQRGIVGNVVGFDTFYSDQNPPNAIVDAVAAGKIDVALVWGPAVGSFVKQQRTPLEMTPVQAGPADPPFAYDMSMGVKKGNEALRVELQRTIDSQAAAIRRVLVEYGVPLMTRRAGGR
jgi:mxaJ protein